MTRPTVRAWPRDQDMTSWWYEIFLWDVEEWTPPMTRGAAMKFLRDDRGLSDQQATDKLTGARKRYRGKLKGNWKGDRGRQ